MKHYFGKRRCPDCAFEYDKTYSACPHCGRRNEDRGALFFDNMVHVHPFKQLGFLICSLIGLFIFVQICGTVAGAVFAAGHPEATQEELVAYLSSAEGLFFTDVPAYLLLFAAMGAILFSDWKQIFKSFTKWKSYIYGVLGFMVVIAFSMLYSISVSGIYAALGRELPGTNENQSLLNLMIVYNPVVSLIVFGFIGPFTEELGYRVGLFGLASRFGKVLGYVITTVVFAFIHFDFGSFADPAALEVELINLPSYLFSGFAFSFLYAKAGFSASYTAHALNNVMSVVVNYFEATNGA
ncbi:MAG: CPBP family intramembrane metalloprotease [Bacilli bacterium]|nr:CPBP family intramembrane metalloprotease [Bacilli bacterium]